MAFPATIDDFTNRTDNVDDVLAANINELQGAGASSGGIEAVEAKLGVDSSAVATSIDYLLKNASSVDPGHKHQLLVDFFVSATTKLYFYANTPPTGWTTVAVTDSVLAVKGGSQAYNVTGGQSAGTWTQPNHDHAYGTLSAVANTVSTINVGSGAADGSHKTHTHTMTGSAAVGATANTYRPLAVIGVIGVKT